MDICFSYFSWLLVQLAPLLVGRKPVPPCQCSPEVAGGLHFFLVRQEYTEMVKHCWRQGWAILANSSFSDRAVDSDPVELMPFSGLC